MRQMNNYGVFISSQGLMTISDHLDATLIFPPTKNSSKITQIPSSITHLKTVVISPPQKAIFICHDKTKINFPHIITVVWWKIIFICSFSLNLFHFNKQTSVDTFDWLFFFLWKNKNEIYNRIFIIFSFLYCVYFSFTPTSL